MLKARGESSVRPNRGRWVHVGHVNDAVTQKLCWRPRQRGWVGVAEGTHGGRQLILELVVTEGLAAAAGGLPGNSGRNAAGRAKHEVHPGAPGAGPRGHGRSAAVAALAVARQRGQPRVGEHNSRPRPRKVDNHRVRVGVMVRGHWSCTSVPSGAEDDAVAAPVDHRQAASPLVKQSEVRPAQAGGCRVAGRPCGDLSGQTDDDPCERVWGCRCQTCALSRGLRRAGQPAAQPRGRSC